MDANSTPKTQQKGLANRELSPQERLMTGSSELNSKDFYKPTFLAHFPQAVVVVNGRRQEAGFIDASMLVNGSGGDPNETYMIDLPPLDPETCETIYDPSIWQIRVSVHDGEEIACLDRELTKRVYENAATTPEYDLQHREGKWKWEIEANTIEGRMRSSPEGMQGRK